MYEEVAVAMLEERLSQTSHPLELPAVGQWRRGSHPAHDTLQNVGGWPRGCSRFFHRRLP